MKYIFFGTPEFSAIILDKLIKADFVPTAVVTNPDRPAGRGKILTASAVKTRIMNQESGIRNTIKILQPETLDGLFINELESVGAEAGVLVAYGKIIPKEVINVFPKGIIVIHPSLLPKYRGATPIQNAILNGDEKTGTTLFLMDEKIDHGPIIANKKAGIMNDDTYETLSQKLAGLSGDLLINTLPEYLEGRVLPKEQNHSQVTYTKKFTSEDGFVDPVDLKEALEKKRPPKAEIIWCKVRALNPEPGVWTIWKGGRRMKILEADLINGNLNLKRVQFDGEKPRLMAE